jgi:hypothetical protein
MAILLGTAVRSGAQTDVPVDAGQASGNSTPATATEATVPAVETWGEFDPGRGFLVGRNEHGELSISAYALVRYLDQMPGESTFVDHLGNERTVDGRNDIFPHRVIIWFKGWMGRPQLLYNIAIWTVNTTNQVALFGNLGYQFNRHFNVYAGINGNPGTRSLQGSHPFWLGNDRVMADEFFRPFFGSGIWAQGDYAEVHTPDGAFLIHVSLKELSGRLDPRRFAAPHDVFGD